jgi:fatty-acyl-CoA synthase
MKNSIDQVPGRIKELREIEDFLYTMPGIKDVQVVGIASEKYGEEVGAFIILHPDVSLCEEDVWDFCRGQISRFKIPRYVFFVESFPLTSSGKIQKYLLRELGTKKAQELGADTV